MSNTLIQTLIREEENNEVESFITNLSETQGWSNTPILSLNKHVWNENFKITNDNARF